MSLDFWLLCISQIISVLKNTPPKWRRHQEVFSTLFNFFEFFRHVLSRRNLIYRSFGLLIYAILVKT